MRKRAISILLSLLLLSNLADAKTIKTTAQKSISFSTDQGTLSMILPKGTSFTFPDSWITPCPSCPEPEPCPEAPPCPACPECPKPPSTLFQLYGSDSVWNKRLDPAAPLSPQSATYVASLISDAKIVSASINTVKFSSPIYFVDGNTLKQKVYLTDQYAKGGPVDLELQKGVPIPASFQASLGTDGHACIIDKTANREYDFWQLRYNNSRWEATNAGILDGVSSSDGRLTRRSDGYWNSATATHLPLAGGTILLSELSAGKIPHALAIAGINPRNTAVYPASTSDGPSSSVASYPEGTRFRFPADITINPSWTPMTKMLVEAIRDYGMIVRDKAGSIAFYLEDPRPYGKDATVIFPYTNNQWEWTILQYGKEFPWDKLQVVS